jgi:hypothetical protein
MVAQTIRKVHEISWKPRVVIFAAASIRVLKPTGLQKSVGLISAGWVMQPGDPPRAVAVAPPSAAGLREMAIMHVAMFDAVNSIDRRYRPYMVQLAASEATSQEAAATAAAARVLIGLHPEAAAQIQAASVSALAAIPEGEAKAEALALGEAVAEGRAKNRRVEVMMPTGEALQQPPPNDK